MKKAEEEVSKAWKEWDELYRSKVKTKKAKAESLKRVKVAEVEVKEARLAMAKAAGHTEFEAFQAWEASKSDNMLAVAVESVKMKES